MENEIIQCDLFGKEIELVKKSGRPVVLFGASIIARCIYKALGFIGVTPACFCDNDSEKRTQKIEQCEVLSPSEVYSKYTDAIVIICLSSVENCIKVEQQLTEIGFRDIKRKDVYYAIYQKYVLNRNISEQEFLETLNILEEKEKYTTLHMVGVVVTQICTLKCKDCSLLIPQYKNPKNYDKHVVINSVRRLAESVDAIEALTLLGGESLLHPDIVEMCEEISQIGNIERIHILTNGTILPDIITLERIKPYITFLIINDYGELSDAKNELMNRCEELDILCQLYPNNDNWYNLEQSHGPLRDKASAINKFKDCIWGKSYMEIQNGKFHICGFSAAGTELGLVKNNGTDFVDLLDANKSQVTLNAEVSALLNERNSIIACEYCGLDFDSIVQRAIQI